jgi:hypothetical protein
MKPFFDDEILQKRLAKYFNIGWNTMPQSFDYGGNPVESLYIYHLWYAQIRYYHSSKFDPLILAVVQTNRWKKGLLLIPPILEPFDREHGGPENLQPVDIEDEHDRVSKNLESLNLVYRKQVSVLDGAYCHFRLSVATSLLYTTIDVTDCGDHIKDPSHRRLWLALKDLVNHMRRLYRHPEITKYVWSRADLY